MAEKSSELAELIRSLAAIEATSFPFISLYLNTRPDQNGHHNFHNFVKKELAARETMYAPHSPQALSFSTDVQEIENFVKAELNTSANSLVIFACSGADGLFQTLRSKVVLAEHEIYVDSQPELFTL